MKEQNDVTKVEFLITLNDNFVVQRFFNVKGFNPRAKSSVELMRYMFDLREDLKTQLIFSNVGKPRGRGKVAENSIGGE